MSPFSHRSIAPFLAVILATMSTAVLSVSGAFAFRALRLKAVQGLQQGAAINAQSLSDALALPLYNFDEAQASLILESRMRDRSTMGLQVRPTVGKPLSLFRPGSPTPAAHPEWIRELREIRRGETALGTLEVYTTLQFMEEDLQRVRSTFIQGILICDLILVLGLYLLLWRFVVKPLQSLEYYAQEVSSGERPTPGGPGALSFREVEHLHHSIEQMVGLLDQRYLAIQESEGRFRALFNSSNDAVFVSEFAPDNLSTHIIEVNEAAQKLTGYERQELIGLSVEDITQESSQETVQQARQELAQGKRCFFECTLLSKQGTKVQVEVNASRFIRASRTFAVSVTRDLTERHRLETQLRHSQKMESLGVLAGGVAHDFNNILQVILSYTNLLEESLPEDHPNREELHQILSAAEKGARLTRSLLVFSRKEALEPSLADLNALAGRMNAFLKRLIGEDIDLSVQLHPQPLYVFVEENQIEQVLMNLATNARDAMPKGGALRIQLDGTNIDDDFIRIHGFGRPGAWARISVSDSGVGMDEATRLRVFDPFFTTKAPGKGTGLGLATVYGIVTQHKGVISVYSEPGHGTTFQVYLPISQELPSTRPMEPPRREQLEGSETLLLAEDEEPLLAALTLILERKGYTVLQARDGLEAVERYEALGNQIDLIIMDMIMPHVSGKEAFEAIRAKSPGVRVLFTSGYSAGLIQSRDDLGAGTDFLMKPMAPVDLLRKIRGILDRP